MGVVEKLNQIKTCKEDIKQAIIDKGVDMTDVAFTEYATKIREITGGSTPEVDDTDYVELTNLGNVNNEAANGLGRIITMVLATEGVWFENSLNTYMGNGNYLQLDIWSPDGSLYTGTYTASATGSMSGSEMSDWQFNIGYDIVDWGIYNWGTCWFGIAEFTTTPLGKVTDGTITVLVENDNLILKLKSSTVNARFTKAISELPFTVFDNGGGEPEVPADFDYLAFRNNMTSYSNDDPNCVPSDYAFCGCPNLQTVDLPNAVGFGMGCFKNCGSLSSVNIPCAVYVADEGFIECGNLTSIDLPNCASVGMNAFVNCTNLQTVNIPNCTYIGQNAFVMTGISSIDLPNCNRIEGYAFQSCNNLTSANIPICTFIGDYTFAWDNSLQELIATEVKTIGYSAFQSCNLPSIDIPKCTQIGDNAFSQNYSLTSVNAPNCGRIGQNAFSDCNMLTTLDLRDIYFCNLAGTEVFNNTPLMNGEGTIYVNAASLDKYRTHWAWVAFADRFVGVGDPNVVLLAFEDGRVYGDTTMLFDGYTEYLGISGDMVTSIDLPNTADMTEQTQWWTGMFQGYPNLQTVAIGKLETVYANMFNSCGALTSIDLPECKHIYANAFGYCSNLTTVNLPKCVYVESMAFDNCNLSSIDLPNCENVGGWAFQNCFNLTTVNLPKCGILGDNAFTNCVNMTTLTIGTELDYVCSMWDTSLPDSLQAIFVPENLVEQYKLFGGWSFYANKIFAVGTEPVIPDTPDTPSNLSEWYLVGNFNGWNCEDTNYQMTVEGDWNVYRNFNADGQGMKFVSGFWTNQVGGNFTGINEPISIVLGEGNDLTPTEGAYDVYLNTNDGVAYFMEVGVSPF